MGRSEDALAQAERHVREAEGHVAHLRAIIEDALMGTMFDLPSRSDVAKVVITPEVISEGKEPTLVPGEPKRKLPAGKTRREGDSAAANRRPSVS